ncbi:unnamed protein product [Cladocopium goreaui]|uniref:Uncharacterized protein n=1 Tax=Cladocopium goreaui TaxID=2562237 RepID=A0A9P1CC14_9DINO|nr:unnamed protein product [Cladocopium goreaui]
MVGRFASHFMICLGSNLGREYVLTSSFFEVISLPESRSRSTTMHMPSRPFFCLLAKPFWIRFLADDMLSLLASASTEQVEAAQDVTVVATTLLLLAGQQGG